MSRFKKIITFYILLVAIITISLAWPKTTVIPGKTLSNEQIEQYRESMKEAANNTLSEAHLNALVEVYVERNTIEAQEIKTAGMEFKEALIAALISSAFLILGVWFFVVYLKHKDANS
ncbi:MAG: hypothetical protein IKV94_00460 [Clostridia bacterium]|nr:hypothetical protein [Clostridia bacterium]